MKEKQWNHPLEPKNVSFIQVVLYFKSLLCTDKKTGMNWLTFALLSQVMLNYL